MSFSLDVARRAEKSLRRIPPVERRRVLLALEAMQESPLAGDVVKLSGMNAFRRRVGSYRVLFTIDFEHSHVGIIDILRRTTTTYR